MSSAKWQPFYLGLDVIKRTAPYNQSNHRYTYILCCTFVTSSAVTTVYSEPCVAFHLYRILNVAESTVAANPTQHHLNIVFCWGTGAIGLLCHKAETSQNDTSNNDIDNDNNNCNNDNTCNDDKMKIIMIMMIMVTMIMVLYDITKAISDFLIRPLPASVHALLVNRA